MAGMSSARPDTWMPIYIGDYLADTMHLNTLEHGAYLLLIFAYWRNGKPLADDDRALSGICRANPKQWRDLRPTLARFFVVDGGVWRHKRIEAELAKWQTLKDKRSEAGANGAAKRWQSHGKRMAEPIANASQTDALNLHHNLEEEKPDAIASVKKKGQPHGTRLPDDWQPDEQDRQFARNFGLDPGVIAPGFRDYWIAKPGADGRKLDWPATWRNWCRRAAADRASGSGRIVNRQGPPSLIAAARAVAARLESDQ
jgi:uncharacterized protein YdaU (DUF1376 family)